MAKRSRNEGGNETGYLSNRNENDGLRKDYITREPIPKHRAVVVGAHKVPYDSHSLANLISASRVPRLTPVNDDLRETFDNPKLPHSRESINNSMRQHIMNKALQTGWNQRAANAEVENQLAAVRATQAAHRATREASRANSNQGRMVLVVNVAVARRMQELVRKMSRILKRIHGMWRARDNIDTRASRFILMHGARNVYVEDGKILFTLGEYPSFEVKILHGHGERLFGDFFDVNVIVHHGQLTTKFEIDNDSDTNELKLTSAIQIDSTVNRNIDFSEYERILQQALASEGIGSLH